MGKTVPPSCLHRIGEEMLVTGPARTLGGTELVAWVLVFPHPATLAFSPTLGQPPWLLFISTKRNQTGKQANKQASKPKYEQSSQTRCPSECSGTFSRPPRQLCLV